MLGRLNADAMSTDESSDERGVYHVRRKDWRSAELLALIKRVDENRNHLNAYGNNLPGGVPRRRERPRHALQSSRRAMKGLPLNFYDKVWYDSLTASQQHALDAQPPIQFPDVDEL